MFHLIRCVVLLGFAARTLALFELFNGLPFSLGTQLTPKQQIFQNGYYSTNGYPSNVLKMMCSSDDCVPAKLKKDIKSLWTDKGKGVWDTCTSETGSCNETTMYDFGLCVFQTMINSTDMTIKEGEDTWDKWSYPNAEKHFEDVLTLKMMKCVRNLTVHRGRYHTPSYGRYHNSSYGRYHTPSYPSYNNRWYTTARPTYNK